MSTGRGSQSLALTVLVERSQELLELMIGVENRSRENHLVNLYPDDGSRSQVLEGRAYVELSPREDEPLVVSLSPPPPPPYLSLERGIVSLSRGVAPGSTIRTRVRLDLPVREWQPYDAQTYPDDTELVQVQSLVVRTRGFAVSRTGWIEPGPEDATYWAQGSDPVEIRQAVGLDRSVPVLKRLDDFWRWGLEREGRGRRV